MAPSHPQQQAQPQKPIMSVLKSEDSLQPRLNLVLHTIGRLFADASARDSERAQIKARLTISASMNLFHQSLDDLEEDLTRAQTVLRRDLALRREEREKKEQQEQAQAAERERATAQSLTANATAEPAALAPPAENAHPEASDDIEMADTSVVDFGFGSDLTMDTKEPDKPLAAPVATMTDPKKPTPIILPNKDTAADTDSTAPPSASKSLDDLFETPTTGNMRDLDFDSMFADMGNDDTNNNEQNTAQSQVDQGEEATNTNNNADFEFSIDNGDNEVSGLLPGLDEYANEGADLSGADINRADITMDGPNLDLDLNIPSELPPDQNFPTSTSAANNTTTSTTAVTATTTTAQDSTQNDNPFPTGDSLDDLFNYDPFGDDNPPAPENTEFDDAFFGFD